MDNVFKKGLVVGGMLAAVAVAGFAMSKPGQNLAEDMQADLKELAKILKKKLQAMQDVSQEIYDKTADGVVAEYAAQKQIAGDAKQHLTAALQAMWGDMEAEYRNAAK